MFDTLSDKLQATLGDLRGRGRLDEETISKAMREIRLALLEADVNFGVVKQFVAGVRERAIGQDVLKSLTPGQQVVKIVHEELTSLMGSGDSRLAFGKPPTVILLAGLQGSGKTTAAAKLALLLRKDGKKPALVAADLQRPAAIDQLEQLGRQIQIPVYRKDTQDPVEVVKYGIQAAQTAGQDVIILDTAGRLHIDDALMEELGRVRDAAKPTNVLLVLDAMTGQEAVNVAESFFERIAFDGVVLTKLDGDARGGAALSVKAVTGKPIKLVSVGEKLDQLEYFHPDRMASRILGMGDVLTLIEKAEAAVEEDEEAEMEARMRAGQFTLRRLPLRAEDAEEDGAAAGRAEDDPRPRQPAEGRRHRRAAAGARRGDRALDDAAGAPHAAPDQRLAAAAHRGGQRADDPGREPAPHRAQADGEDDEADGEGENAYTSRPTHQDRQEIDRMAVRMRLTRVGSKKNPIYRVVVADSRSPRDGRFIEIVGRYNPQTDPSTIELDDEKIKDWIGKGAQPSDAVAKLIKAAAKSEG